MIQKKNRILILFIISLLFPVNSLLSQQFTIGVQFTGISIHPRGALHSHLMPLRLDREGIFVLNPGMRINFEYFFHRNIFSIKFAQGLYGDCTMSFAGFSHIGFRGRILNRGNHTISGGLGPTFFFRRNWYRFDGYRGNDLFFRGSPDDRWQRRFIPIGGEFNYHFRISSSSELAVSLVPFYPAIIQLGARRIINEYREGNEL